MIVFQFEDYCLDFESGQITELALDNIVTVLLVSQDNASHFWHRDAPSVPLPAELNQGALLLGLSVAVTVPSHRLEAQTCSLHLIYNIAEKKTEHVLKERMKKKENSPEKSEKSRHWKGQALRTQEESQEVPPKQSPLRLSDWVPWTADS